MKNYIPLMVVLVICIAFAGGYFAFKSSQPTMDAIGESEEVRDLKDRARAYADANEYERSIEYYTEALKMRPDDAYLHNDLGAVYHNMGIDAAGETWPSWEEDLTDTNPVTALQQLKQALSEVQSGVIVMTVNSMEVMNTLANHARASGCYVHIEHHQRTSDLNIIKGKTMEAFRKAESELLRAKDLKPRYSAAYQNLGSLYYRMGRQKDAVIMWKSALDLEPTNKKLRQYLQQYDLTLSQ
ncbi:MAG: tetratricopeptide repeat protein [Candidatus Poribacteria bacterium]